MLAAMVVSGVLSRRNVRGVRCEIETVGEVVATRPAWLKLRLQNRLKTGTAQSLFFLHEALPGPLWIDPLAPGETRELVVEGKLPAPRRLPRRGRRAPLAVSDRPLPQVPARRARARDRRLPAAGGERGSRGPARGLPRRPAAPALARRRHRHPHPARVLARRRSARPALEAVGAHAPLDRARARGRARPGRLPGGRQRPDVPGRLRRARTLRASRRALRGTGAPAALAGRRGRLPRPGRQGRRARPAAAQRLRILEALARLEPVPDGDRSPLPAMRRGDLRWFVA